MEVSADGWRVLDEAPVYFRRPAGMLPLPTPVKGGKLDALRKFVNVASDDDWRLVLGWLVGAMHPKGPYPVLALHGERGSAKSNATRLLRTVVDPRKPATQGIPKEEHNLVISAQNGWVLALDNLSQMPASLSDFICRLATGAGSSVRALYTDDGEAIFDARRPVVFNGIEDLATRGDLLDRALVVTLPSIPEDGRRTEMDVDNDFAAAHPRILGALLDAVSCALRNQAMVHLARLPRMADFAVWVTAAESALGWQPGAFMKAYDTNRENAVNIEVDAHPVARAIQALMRTRVTWTGTATELYEALKATLPDVERETQWPQAANKLSNAITRIAPALRARKIHIASQRGERGKEYTITCPQPDDTDPKVSSARPKVSSGWGGYRQETSAGTPENIRMADDADDTFPLFSVANNEQKKERGET